MRVATALIAATLAASGSATAEPSHALSLFGDVKYGPDFAHFDYVNPDAPKGGEIALSPWVTAYNQNFDTFNTLEGFVLRGDAPPLIDLTFASLMVSADDEPATMYGYVAETVDVAEDGDSAVFALRPEAVFHDGSALTAADVAFSITTLRDEGHPVLRGLLDDVETAEATDPQTLSVTFSGDHSPDLLQTVAGLPIFSRAYYETHTFGAGTLEAPLGSGLYRVGELAQGRFIEYDRVADHWAADLPVNRGRWNFGTIRLEFYRDRNVRFEGFKSGQQRVNEEYTSRIWATGYDFPAVEDGRVIRMVLPDRSPAGGQGWFMNTRREKFQDPRVREALGLAFDFEWTNRNLFYGLYERNHSFFQSSPMMATGEPSPEELALLEPYRDQLPEEVFGEPYAPPASDGSGSDRRLLREAARLLNEAGFTVENGVRRTPDGEPFTVEFLDRSGSTFDRIINPMIRNLETLGIRATLRQVDAAQYQALTNDYDFDVVSSRLAMSMYLSEGFRRILGSEGADVPGNRNYAGVKDPVIDALIDEALAAETLEEQYVAARALDRVHRAGRYWIPQWYKASHFVALWDEFERPQEAPPYALTGALGTAISTWWYDEDGMDNLPDVVLEPGEPGRGG